jgi:cyclopropane fatty-acyl-phospholipid synthase-like methyltransferase
VDVQEKMVRGLQKRARKAGLADRITTRVCPPDSLGLQEFKTRVDFALAFAVLHEMPSTPAFFREVAAAMKPGGLCLVAEPRGHVTVEDFQSTLSHAVEKGFSVVAAPEIVWSHTALLKI